MKQLDPLPPRPSEFYIYSNCPASYQLMRASGEEPATTYAFKGTRIHKVLAGHGGMELLDPDESKTFEELWEAFRVALREWRGSDKIDEVWSEEVFPYLSPDGKTIFLGHPDRIIRSGSRLFIVDYKTGYHTLDAITATNCQLRGYVALADANLRGITEITVWIDKPGKRDLPAVFDRGEITRARVWSLDLVQRVADPEVSKQPNKGDWCKYCSGKVICPAWKQEIQNIAASQDVVDIMPDEALALLAPKLDIAAKVIDRLKARLEERVRKHPGAFPGWHFRPGQLRPKIEDAHQAFIALCDVLNADTFMSISKIGIGDLVAAYREQTGCTWEAARYEVEKKLGEALTYIRQKDSLVYELPKPAIEDADGH
jgi:hypothetical protein